MLHVNSKEMFPIYKKKKKSPSAPKKRKKSKPDLVKRLDKVFALYIRLRDCMPSGMGQCISCGKIKPYSAPKKRKKSKPDLVKRLDKVFALYIRLRDCMPSGMGQCISCGKIKPYRELDCGHFFGRSNMATRFDEDNCNAECIGCNRVKSDHLIYYQENLIKKIGVSRFSTLRERAHSIKKWDDDELEKMIKYYTNEVKRLSDEKGITVNL